MENLDQGNWIERAKSTDAIILDVRSDVECEEGIVSGAKMLDLYRADEFMSELGTMDLNKEYYIYCRSGNRSGQACMIMESKGFKKVFNLAGGMLEWEGDLVQP